MTIKMVLNEGRVPVKIWTADVEASALQQLINTSQLPFIHKHVAAMPDVHWGMGSTVGSVIPTKGAIVPAAVGVDIGCGMMAVETTLWARDLPDSLLALRGHIEAAVPHGFETVDGYSLKGSWAGTPPVAATFRWAQLAPKFAQLCELYPQLSEKKQPWQQMGTLGGGNHFIEICLDTFGHVWVMLHSGSRGIGNLIGQIFIELAKKDMERHFIGLPDRDLAYLVEGSEHFEHYWQAMQWAQEYAMQNRQTMMENVIVAMSRLLPPFTLSNIAVNCHHNYTTIENHYGENVYVTRKGAVRAREGDLGIIPGSMGAKSFIVRGKGNPESFNSCSHGAGRAMSRSAARKQFTERDVRIQTEGVECRKDAAVIDEIPMAYKDIDAVMNNQADLVDIVATLRQVLCVKG